ncbi:hypothetical protein B0H63DRAFT_550551 [Podospora didyma]|uniref:Extracellular membrane protein CFEM domain-containing protein n=1 Tax=Podospora didyma TaxID=330526 RepID=A0AAE0N650_9PEZI|nr:hypothetical protein B0H63DRAFT_550551 [Podospora didyma]
MYPRSPLFVTAVLALSSVVSAAIGTICRNQDPYISCTVAIVQAVTPPCEANPDKAAATSCLCSTLSLHKSCYERLCTTSDTFIDIFNTMFNSKTCPNAPPLKTPVYTTAVPTNAAGGGGGGGGGGGNPATTTPPATGAGQGSTGAAGAASTTTSKGGAAPQGSGGDMMLLSVAGVVGGAALFGALL